MLDPRYSFEQRAFEIKDPTHMVHDTCKCNKHLICCMFVLFSAKMLFGRLDLDHLTWH